MPQTKARVCGGNDEDDYSRKKKKNRKGREGVDGLGPKLEQPMWRVLLVLL
jgi:hypothetical protein